MYLEQLIHKGKRQEAIRIMTDVMKQEDMKVFNDIILIGAQMTRIEELKSRNLISYSDFSITDNQIVNALLEIIQKNNNLKNFDNKKYRDQAKTNDIQKKKILFFAANPSDQPKLKFEKEYLSIRKIMKPYRDKFDVVEEFDVTLDSFFESIYLEQPEVIHFSGFADENILAFCRKGDQKTHKVPYEFLVAAFKMLPRKVECLFVNTQFTNLFAKISSQTTQHAIGISGAVSDNNAISFASGYYTSLAIEGNHKKAFENGEKVLSSGEIDLDSNYLFYTNGVAHDKNDKTPDAFYIPSLDVEIHLDQPKGDATDNPFKNKQFRHGEDENLSRAK